MKPRSAGHLHVERLLSNSSYFRLGSGCDRRLLEFIAGKPTLKVRFP